MSLFSFNFSCDIVNSIKLFEEDIRFCLCPGRNKSKLQWEMDNLRRAKADVGKQVHEETYGRPRMRCNFKVQSWLESVESLDEQANRLLQSLAERTMGLSLSSPEEHGRTSNLINALSFKRFLLLMDDEWEHLDLEKIGIPSLRNHNRGKLLLTTRDEVCTDMDVKERVKVGLLDRNE